jgi:tetratricopeptide (TPR) repeat protein
MVWRWLRNYVAGRSSGSAGQGWSRTEGSQSKREVRVFVSSTFLDMHAEREELVKKTFPALRKMCEQRGVVWGEVDLRWGVTEEQKAEGQTLPICLEEIQRCRPYFIGLLGDYYGSIQDVPEALIERQPWLREYQTRSVTELEILHGVLRNPKLARHAYFYFRARSSRPHVTRQLSDADRMLQQLKRRIEKSRFPVSHYSDPKMLSEQVLRDFSDLVDRNFPAVSKPGTHEEEEAAHEVFAASLGRFYVRRPSDDTGADAYRRLDSHAAGDGPPLVVSGESGIGKSTLLANWATKYRKEHSHDMVLMHLAGGTLLSTDWAAMLRRMLTDFNRRLEMNQAIPEGAQELRVTFAQTLHRIALRTRLVLVMDGMNQLEDRDGALGLAWLPLEIPSGIRLVLSTVDGPTLAETRRRRWPELQLTPLGLSERQILVAKCLEHYGKALPPKLIEKVTSSKRSGNPLYLRTLLEELRVYGNHETLSRRIDHYLTAQTVTELFDKVLERYEADYEGDHPGLVREAASLIWVSRRGLAEVELLDMIGTRGEPLPRAFWSPLFLALESALVIRSGLIGFSHEYLRQAVKNRYLQNPGATEAARDKLLSYFQAGDRGYRRTDEVPWQSTQAQKWDLLAAWLADPASVRDSWDRNESDVRSYWATLEKNSAFKRASVYEEVVQNPGRNVDHSWIVGLLLGEGSALREALRLRAGLTSHFRARGQWQAVASNLGIAANLHYVLGEFSAAVPLHDERIRIHRRIGPPERLAAAIGDRALVVMDLGKAEEALELFREEEKIFRSQNYWVGLQASLGNQSLILKQRGDMDAALERLDEQEAICRREQDMISLSNCLGNQGEVMFKRRAYDKAIHLLKEQEQICLALGHMQGLARCLGDQALVLAATGNHTAALATHQREQATTEQVGDIGAVAVSLVNQGELLGVKMHRTAEGLTMVDRAMTLVKGRGMANLEAEAMAIRARIEQARRLSD